MNATISLNDEQTKALLTEVVIDLIKNKREVLHEIILEALEEVGLANAIIEGRENNFVSEDDIFSILKGKNE
jgi:tRNA A37 threonylcarbamoyladenosine modification protein TsaB